MVTNFRHDRERLPKRRLFFMFALLMFAVYFFSIGPVEHVTAGVLQTLARPLLGIELTMSDWFLSQLTYFRSKADLEKENIELHNELELIGIAATTRETLRAENDQLKAALGRSQDAKYLLTMVLANPDRSPYDTLIIDAGTVEGVGKGMHVFGDGDFVIGEVTETFGHSAVVTLYSSSGNELPVTVGTSSLSAVAHGMGGGTLMIQLPKGVRVREGDVVGIPALAPTFAGTVIAVDTVAASSFQNIYVRLPFNLNSLRHAYVAVTVQ